MKPPVLLLLILFISLFKVSIFGYVLVSDICLVLFCLYILCFKSGMIGVIVYQSQRGAGLCALLFLIANAISILFNMTFSHDLNFSLVASVVSWIHLLMFVLFFYFALTYFRSLSQFDLQVALLKIATVLTAFAWIRYLLVQIGVFDPVLNEIYKGRGHIVLVGIFNEPAHLSIFLSLVVAFLQFSAPRLWIHYKLLFCITIVMTFSLSGYLLLFLVVLLFLIFEQQMKVLRFSILIVITAVVSAVLLTDNPVSSRLFKTLAMTDSSSSIRLVGSWFAVMNFEELWQFVLGIGLGNYNTFIELNDAQEKLGNLGSWNILSYVMSTSGFIGLIWFLAILYFLARANIRFFTVFALALFAYGELAGPTFWLFLALGIASKRSFRPALNDENRPDQNFKNLKV